MAKNNYWMKLWFEILGDPKMGRLPDRLWRRVIELFLIAGQNGEEGKLPELVDMAWQLKLSEKALQNDLEKIQETGIVKPLEDGSWIVTNFQKRNKSVTGTQRVKDYRDRTRYEISNAVETEDDKKCNASVTGRYKNCNADVTMRYQEEEVDTDTEKDKESTTTTTAREEISEVVKSYESEVGILTGMIREKLVGALEEYPKDWIVKALEECASKNKRNWSYAEAILKRWKVEGFQTDSRQRVSNPGYKKQTDRRPDIPGYVSDRSNEVVVYD